MSFFPFGGAMPRVGTCRDRLADAIERFGRVPIVKRTITVHPDDPALSLDGEAPYWAAGGLVHDGQGRVLLLRHEAPSRWGDAWVTPGGRLEEGETTVDGFRRETFEEVEVEVTDPALTRIFNETLTDGARVRHGYFAQFTARAGSDAVTPGRGVREARWFEALPESLAFREDYVEDFRRLRDARF
jgi:ADP-ribose pyrophosphatase YjhB (NUDIX family)